MTPDKRVEENIKSALVPWMESFGTKETFDKIITAIDSLHKRVAELESLAYPVAINVDNEGKISTQHHQDLMSEAGERDRIVKIIEEAYIFDDQYLSTTGSSVYIRAGGQFIKENILQALTEAQTIIKSK